MFEKIKVSKITVYYSEVLIVIQHRSKPRELSV